MLISEKGLTNLMPINLTLTLTLTQPYSIFSLQKNPVLITELRDDIKRECEKFGEVRKVIVFDVSVFFEAHELCKCKKKRTFH